jgi:hypothetical protein
MLLRVPESLVNIAHFQKINELGRCLPIETFLRLPHGRGRYRAALEFLDEYRQTPFVSQVDPNLVFHLSADRFGCRRFVCCA